MVDVTVSSNYLNLLNFILFDVLFCALIFYVTADIAGLLNARSALTKQENRLSAFNPPVLGVGLTCTRRRVFFTMAFIRLLAIALFFVTNFLIEGKSVPRIVAVRNATVTTFGPPVIPASRLLHDRRKVDNLISRRQECLGRTDRYMFYGEIRDGQCVTKFNLIKDPVMFSLGVFKLPINMRADSCVITYGNHTWIQRCNSALVKCKGNRTYVPAENCAGVLRFRKRSFLCSGRALYMYENASSAVCREVRGAIINENYWVPLYGDFVNTIQGVFDYIYMSGTERRLVLDEDGSRLVSEVYLAWFVILTFVVLLLVVLFTMSVYLRCNGLVRCANDEVGLGSLLALNAESSVDTLPSERSRGVLRGRRTPPSGSSDSQLFVVYNNGEITATRGR